MCPTQPRSPLAIAGAAFSVLAATCLIGACSSQRSAKTVAWEQLIRELGDPARIAGLDTPGASILTSHDRTGGNADYNNVLGTDPDGWEILADLEGPGYITRFWMTGAPEDHRIRFYFDNERNPRIDATISSLAGQGGVAPFLSPLCTYEQLCYLVQLPIPYQKRVRVLSAPRTIDATGWPRLFYQLEYATLAEGNTVESFPREIPPATINQIRSMCRQWDEEAFPPALDSAPVRERHLDVGPGRATDLYREPGPGIIRLLQLKIGLERQVSERSKERALRQVRLQAFWDGMEEPSVDVPLGDFFGSPWQSTQFQSMFFGQADGTFYSRFPMPFATSAHWVLSNEGPASISVDVGVHVERGSPPDAGLGYFHAAWNRSGPEDIGKPHVVLRTSGKGAYVGCLLTVTSQVNNWWILESDETISTDELSSPSWQGTGLEDYFNGGWYYQYAQARPTHGVLFKSPFQTVQYRTHLTDPVRFGSRVDVRFERGPDNASPGWMESTAFYYLARPHPAASSIPPPDARQAPASEARRYTLMAELLNRERLGDIAGACAAIDAYCERFPDADEISMLRLRQLAYRERLEGFDVVETAYREVADAADSPVVARGAQDLLWFHEDPSHALLSLYCRNRTRAFLDGRPLVQINDPQQIFVLRTPLEPGRHVLALQAETASYPEWVLAHLRAHGGDIATMPDWRFAYQPSGDWNKPGYDDSDWSPMSGNGVKGPPEVPFVFIRPGPHVLSVSQARGLRPRGPARQEQGTFVFRKAFTIPPPAP